MKVTHHIELPRAESSASIASRFARRHGLATNGVKRLAAHIEAYRQVIAIPHGFHWLKPKPKHDTPTQHRNGGSEIALALLARAMALMRSRMRAVQANTSAGEAGDATPAHQAWAPAAGATSR